MPRRLLCPGLYGRVVGFTSTNPSGSFFSSIIYAATMNRLQLVEHRSDGELSVHHDGELPEESVAVNSGGNTNHDIRSQLEGNDPNLTSLRIGDSGDYPPPWRLGWPR